MNKKYKIKVPATSANLGPGFDCLGIALNLYNEFIIEKNDEYIFINVVNEFANEENLFIQGAKKVYEYYNSEEIKFSLEIIENVPICRGLGSSATCIIGGIVGGFIMLGKEIDKTVVLKLANVLEGHPDNVAPALLGGLVASFISDENVYSYKYQVNEKIIFNALIPDFQIRTSLARNVLPKSLDYKSVVYSMSRAINIPKLLETGDFIGLYAALNDKIHQPYRLPLIHESDKFIEFANKEKLPFVISGSGSTLLMLSKKSIKGSLDSIKVSNKWQYLELKIDTLGTQWEVING